MVVGDGDVVVLKVIRRFAMDEFDGAVKKARIQANVCGPTGEHALAQDWPRHTDAETRRRRQAASSEQVAQLRMVAAAAAEAEQAVVSLKDLMGTGIWDDGVVALDRQDLDVEVMAQAAFGQSLAA